MKSLISTRALGFALGAAGALLCTAAPLAANLGSAAEAQATYQRDRAACLKGETSQDRATCLQEAGAALQEAKRGRLTDGDAQYERNRLQRCDRQPLEDRADCIRRMNGEGSVSGSVEGGGVLRELVTPVKTQ